MSRHQFLLLLDIVRFTDDTHIIEGNSISLTNAADVVAEFELMSHAGSFCL